MQPGWHCSSAVAQTQSNVQSKTLLLRRRMLLGKVKTFPSSFHPLRIDCLSNDVCLPPPAAGVLHSMEQRSFARRHRHLGKISLQAFLWQVVNLLSFSSSLSPLPFLPAPFVHLICSQRLISWVNISTRYYGQFKRCPRFIEPGWLVEGRCSWLVGYFSFAFSVKEEAPPSSSSIPKKILSHVQPAGRKEGGMRTVLRPRRGFLSSKKIPGIHRAYRPLSSSPAFPSMRYPLDPKSQGNPLSLQKYVHLV